MSELDKARQVLRVNPGATDAELADAVWGPVGTDTDRRWMGLVSRAEWGWNVSRAEKRYIAARVLRRAAQVSA